MDYPWSKEYRVCKIPASLEPYPNVPTHYFLDHVAEKYPRIGCVQLGLELPYVEIKDHADRLAYALAAMGVGKGDRVMTMLPTSIQYVVADSGISKAGAIHVPCSFLEPVDELAHKFNESSPKAMICLDTQGEIAQQLRPYMQADNIIAVSLEDYSAKLPKRTEVPGTLRMLDVIEQARPEPPAVSIDPVWDLETLLFTGGTTGVAKGCMLTHRNIVANSIQNPVVFGPVRHVFEGNMSALMGLPLFHSYGHCVMHTMISCCYNMLLVVEPRDYRSMMSMIERYCPVLQIGVPTQFMRMIEEGGKKIKVIGVSGSAPLPSNVQEQFGDEGGGFLTEGYGLSEMSPVALFNVSSIIRVFGGRRLLPLTNTLLFNRLGTALLRAGAKVIGPKWFGKIFVNIAALMGRISKMRAKTKRVEKRSTIGIPLPDTQLKIIDVDTGEPYSFQQLLQEGKVGELLLSGPQRMLGYWPNEGSGLDEEGFVHTGDVVKMDENGYFSIVDRTKDMVIVSGYKVYTKEMDDVLYEHPATDIAASIGVPDPTREGSELVIAFVQLKDEYKGKVTEADYFDFLKQKVAKYAVPREIVFLDEMPLTGIMKVDKKALRQVVLEKAPAAN